MLSPPCAGRFKTSGFFSHGWLWDRRTLLIERSDPASTASQNLHVSQAQSSAKRASWMRSKRDFVLAVRRRRSNREPSRQYRMYTHSHFPAWAIMHNYEENVEGDRGQNASLLHSITNSKKLWEPVRTWLVTPSEIAEGSSQISVSIQFSRGLTIEPSCWWCRKLSSSRWRQSRVACFAKCTILLVVSWQKSHPLCFGQAWSHIVPLEYSVLLQWRVCLGWLEHKTCQQWSWKGVRLLYSFHILLCFPCFWREKLSWHHGSHQAFYPLPRCSVGHHERPRGLWDLLLYTAP